MTPYRLAIFDFDGTLADSFPWFVEVLNQVARRFGFRPISTDELDDLRGMDGRRIMAHLGIPLWKVPMLARHMRRLMARDIDRIALFPGVHEMLHELHAGGMSLAMVTSNTEANVRRLLGSDTASLISLYGCDTSLFGKRRKLRWVLRKSGVAVTEAMYIGDEIRDLRAAQAIGMPFGAVTWGFTRPEALAARHPTVTFSEVGQIAERLLRD